MNIEGMKWWVKAEDFRNNEVICHSPSPVVRIETIEDEHGQIVEARCSPPEYFTLRPKTSKG